MKNDGGQRQPDNTIKQIYFYLIFLCIYNIRRIMYKHHVQDQQSDLIRSIETIVFDFLKLQYHPINIPLNQQQFIHAIFIPTKHANQLNHYYLGHGFGGSSLMFFTVVEELLLTGSVVLWQIRGMGMSKKLKNYEVTALEDIELFYIQNIKKLLLYYNHSNVTFICHSLSAYLILLFTISQPLVTKKYIKSLVLLSPVGITPKELDYKNQIHSISDVFHTLLNKFSWTFNLSYKSALRTLCCCCKKSILSSSLKDSDLTQQERQIMSKIIQTLILLPDGAEHLFFTLFYPRVLPKIAIQTLVQHEPQIKWYLVFGGEEDWVDKSGPKRLHEKYGDKIQLVIYEKQGHNFPFYKEACKKIFKQLILK